MRFARVIGQVTMTVQHPDLVRARWLVVRTMNRRSLVGHDEGNDETLVMYDDLGARVGDVIALVEGREATSPFGKQRVPIDCYNAAILEQIDFRPVEPVE